MNILKSKRNLIISTVIVLLVIVSGIGIFLYKENLVTKSQDKQSQLKSELVYKEDTQKLELEELSKEVKEVKKDETIRLAKEELAAKKAEALRLAEEAKKAEEEKAAKEAEEARKAFSNETASSTEQTDNSSSGPSNTDYVLVTDYIPDILVELKYATTDNFTGQVIYDFTDAYLRYGTVKKLAVAQEKFKAMGYKIKIWDAYRPFYAQEKLWEVVPDSRYVANPANGMKAHNLGGSIDITLVTFDGTELTMPTAFDDFSAKADRDYSDVSAEAAANAQLMEDVMESCGFTGYFGEWWDFSDTNINSFPAVDFQP